MRSSRARSRADFFGVFEEYADRVLDSKVLLGGSTGTVDTRGSLGGVATHETAEVD